MKIPKGINEGEAVEVIMKIAKRLAPKYVFASYDVEDIQQEAFLIGIAGLEKYDQKRPLENFMYTHINNRLKTFKRDNYYRLDYGTAAQKIQDRKKNLLEPVDIDAIYSVYTNEQSTSNAQIHETLELIDKKLPAHLRRDYLKLQSNSPLPKGRKAIVIETIERIINGDDYEEEG
jgi:DNA-directed RNA polymerase specialized sigma24 family protein